MDQGPSSSSYESGPKVLFCIEDLVTEEDECPPQSWYSVYIHPFFHPFLHTLFLLCQGGSSVSFKAKRLELWRDPRRRTRLSSIHLQINYITAGLHHPERNDREIGKKSTHHSLRITTSDRNKKIPQLLIPANSEKPELRLLTYLLTYLQTSSLVIQIHSC